MLADLGAPQPGDIAFRLVRAGAILAIGFAMIDPLHFKAGMEFVPSSCLVGVHSAASGDATANDRNGLGLMFHHCRHGRAASLAHHHNTTALAALVLASTSRLRAPPGASGRLRAPPGASGWSGRGGARLRRTPTCPCRDTSRSVRPCRSLAAVRCSAVDRVESDDPATPAPRSHAAVSAGLGETAS